MRSVFWEKLLHWLVSSTELPPEDAEGRRWNEKLLHRTLDALVLCAQAHRARFAAWAASSSPPLVAALQGLQQGGKQSPFVGSLVARLLPLCAAVAATAATAAGAAAAESEAERRTRMREEAKARQRKIQERMQAERDQFAAKNKVELGASEAQQNVEVCVLCRDAGVEQANPLCHMVLAQTWGAMADTMVASPGGAAEPKVSTFVRALFALLTPIFFAAPEDGRGRARSRHRCAGHGLIGGAEAQMRAASAELSGDERWPR